ncbi:kinase-like domain-containing protein [Rhodocollybia butyracea]|uniref:non-specific serine/threonine protein kinase n=1 Tax=Rhodocollybia butyracea TaxID=206335 RepID=A0A9P5PWB8_9AGAR|nr:kinase-like domain-containing protein [Rhodocollybia butyracea]
MSTNSESTVHFPARLGASLQDNRYTILRKLGEGVTATTWLIRDERISDSKYAAVKILTAEATLDVDQGVVRELEFLKEIAKNAEERDDEGLEHLPILLDNFSVTGPGGTRHLCLVQVLFSTSVSALRRSAPTKSLPVYMVRNILYMVLQALDALHSLDIIHTDVKLDNILFTNALYSLDDRMDAFLAANPVETDGDSPKSQPIPHEWTYETSAFQAERMTVVLVDLGHAQRAGEQPTAAGFSAPALRAPEVILWSDIGPKMDIWAIGCLTFELLVGRWLFDPEDAQPDWSIEDDHLAKMMELTGRKFPETMLARAKERDRYFDKNGNLLRIPDLVSVKLEDAMTNYNIPGLPKNEIELAAEFMRDCLKFDYKERASAKELINHPFLKNVFGC